MSIKAKIESFLENWDRHEWMRAHGEWESTRWDASREEYENCVRDLWRVLDDAPASVQEAFDAVLPSSEWASADTAYELETEYESLELSNDLRKALESPLAAVIRAAYDLDGQVNADNDYIAEGLIDPDGVSEVADHLDEGESWQDWDCREGWAAFSYRGALYMNWWRTAFGHRHERDLWVKV